MRTGRRRTSVTGEGLPRSRLTPRYVTVYRYRMGLSNAERQRRFRERRKEHQPRIHYRGPQDRRSRPQR